MEIHVKNYPRLFALSSCLKISEMRRVPVYLLLAIMAAAMACGRGGGDTVTVPALLEAERLLSPEVDAADSALRVLRAVDTAALSTDGDRALYALLHTQALYKLTDDPIDTIPILRAVDHYATTRPGSDRHVRALTYAGAAAMTNGNHVAAMSLYKTAELTTDTLSGDTTMLWNLAYAKLRIGSLLSTQLNEEKHEIAIFKEALGIFSRIKDWKYVTATLFDIGTSYAMTDFDSSSYYITKALELTKIRRDSAFTYDCLVRLAQINAHCFRDYNTALSYLDSAMDINRNQDASAIICRSTCLAHLGKDEEANQILEKALRFSFSTSDSIAFYKAKEAIAIEMHDEQEAEFHRTMAQRMTEKLEIAAKPITLNNAAMSAHYRFRAEKQKRDELMWQIPACAVTLILFLALALIWRRSQRSNKLALGELRQRITSIERSRISAEMTIRNVTQELEEVRTELATTQTNNTANVHRVNELNEQLSLQQKQIENLIRQHRLLSVVNEHIFLKGRHKGLGTIIAVLGDELQVSELPDSFWNDIFEYVDSSHNGLISHIKTSYLSVSDKEIRLLCLSAINLSNNIIAKCLDYTSTQSVRNIKSNLPKRKMNIEMSVDALLSMWRSKPYNATE